MAKKTNKKSTKRLSKTAHGVGRKAQDSLSKVRKEGGPTAHYLGRQAHEMMSEAQATGGLIAKGMKRQMPGAVKETISQVRKEGSRAARPLGPTMRGVDQTMRAAFEPGYARRPPPPLGRPDAEPGFARCARCGRKFPIPGYCVQCALEMKM